MDFMLIIFPRKVTGVVSDLVIQPSSNTGIVSQSGLSSRQGKSSPAVASLHTTNIS